MSAVRKIAIIVGHGNGDSGAIGWNEMEEFVYNSQVAEEINRAGIDKEIKVFYRTSTGILGVANRVAEWAPDLSIELHLNAFNGKARGCEVLCLGSDHESVYVAGSFAASFSLKFKRVLRENQGIKLLSPRDRGFASLNDLKKIRYSILVEPFFIDNKEEWIDPKDYTEFLIEWLRSL